MDAPKKPLTVIGELTRKRLIGELRDLAKEKLSYGQGIQDEENPLIFYFLIVGENGSDYEGGYYIGMITLPATYPQDAGSDVKMLTPNGRFEEGHSICLTNTKYHPESQTPAWKVSSMIIGLYSIFITDVDHGISHIRRTSEERKKLAKQSAGYNKNKHMSIFKRFDRFVDNNGDPYSQDELKAMTESDELKKKEKKEKKEKNDTVTVKINEDGTININKTDNDKIGDIKKVEEVVKKDDADKTTKVNKDMPMTSLFTNYPEEKKQTFASRINLKKATCVVKNYNKDEYKKIYKMSNEELFDILNNMTLFNFDKVPFEVLKSRYQYLN